MKRNPMPKRYGTAWVVASSRAAQQRRLARGDARVRALVLARDNYACSCCGTPIVGRPYSFLRRSRDAGDSPVNLLTFLGDGTRPDDPDDHCARVDLVCDPMDAVKGYRLFSWQDPALEPVCVFGPTGGITVWLSAAGLYETVPRPGPAAQPDRAAAAGPPGPARYPRLRLSRRDVSAVARPSQRT